MSEDLQRIRRFVERLVRRERVLLLARVALQGAMLAAALVILGLAAAAVRWDRSAATAAVVVIGGIGAWGLVALPLWISWRRAGDVARQAGLVETLAPELRGRLRTAVDRIGGPRGHESPAMLGLVARRAVSTIATVDPARVHPPRSLYGVAAAAAVVHLAAVVVAFGIPGGPGSAWRWWTEGGVVAAAVAVVGPDDQPARARVGDIALRYEYPSYTGLEPHEVTNSTGDVQGPPGTLVRVTARSADPVEAAALAAYDDPALDAGIVDGRTLSASFTIRPDPGTYKLITYRQGAPEQSREFAVTPEPDLPPEVILGAPTKVVQVAVDERLSLSWRARDDYGVSRVVIEIDGQQRGRVLREPRQRLAEVAGAIALRPVDLGLSQGDDVRLAVAAWDNDTYSGSKVGRSQEIRLVVLGGRGLDKRADERQDALVDLLLDVLADSLEEPWPPGPAARDIAVWGEHLSRRYAPVDDFMSEHAYGLAGSQLESRVLEKINRTARELIRYTQVAFLPDDRSAPAPAAIKVTAGLRDDAIAALEDGILAVDRAIRLRAFKKVVEDAERLAATATEIQVELSRDEVDPQAMLARLDKLEHMLRELARNTARLDDGGLKEFLAQRNDEMRNLMEEVRAALAEGRMEDARELMSRLARQMQDMQQDLQDKLEQMRSESDDTMQQAQDLTKELTALEDAQRALQERTRALREQSNDAALEQVEQLWDRAEALAKQASEAGSAYAGGLEQAERSFNEQQRALEAVERTDRVLRSVQARDLRGARRALDNAAHGWRNVERSLAYELRRRGELPGPGARDVARMQNDLTTLEQVLEQLERRARDVDPEVREQARELAQEQQALEERLEQAGEQARQLAREFPVRPDGLEESLEEAGEQMGRSSEDLGNGQPMPAEGAQGVAAQRIADARDALEQAMQQAAQQQQQLQDGQQGQSEGQGGEGRADAPQQQPIEIPSPEDFRTPEEYRRELLEGMEGDVPEEYRALKKRYFEELVNQ